MPPLRVDIQSADLDRSIERIARAETQRANATGFPTTRQGRALFREFIEQLTVLIEHSRCCRGGRDTPVLLRDKESKDIADDLLFAGMMLGTGKSTFDDDESALGKAASWIGRTLGYRGETAVQVGIWGFRHLLKLPIFILEDGLPTLALTNETDNFLNEVLANSVRRSPLLLPFTSPPAPWTQVSKGVTAPDHWARPHLVGRLTAERLFQKAISNGSMRPVLNALNFMQAVPFCINQPILNLLRREPVAPIPGKPSQDLSPFRQWLAETERREAKDRQQAWNLDLSVAGYLAGQSSFHVPLNLDFRGRVNAIPHFRFAREDPIRALFMFARGHQLGSRDCCG